MKQIIEIIQDKSFHNFRNFFKERGFEIPKGYYIMSLFGKCEIVEQYFKNNTVAKMESIIDSSMIYDNYHTIEKCIAKWLPDIKTKEQFIKNMKYTRESLDTAGISEKGKIDEFIVNAEKGYIACLYKNKEIKVYGLKTDEERARFEYPYRYEIDGVESTRMLLPVVFEDNQEIYAGELCRLLEAVTNIYIK